MSEFERVVRAIQSRLPFLMEAKVFAQKVTRYLLKIPFENDFKLLANLSLNSNSLILDIGGNRGQSIDAIRLYHKGVQIISFEPNALLAERLDKAYGHDQNVNINHFGLGDVSNKIPLFTPYYYEYMYDGLSSFDYNEAHDWINQDTIAWFNPEKLEIKESICEIKRLDDLNLTPDFIKIDVQGFEKNVLIGGAKTIETNKPLIMFEINRDAEEYMKSINWVQCFYEKTGLTHKRNHYHDNVFFYHPQSSEKFKHLFID